MQNLDPSVLEKVNSWLTPLYDAETQDHINKLIADQAFTELTDSFYRDLEFGTGGLRGVMGPGSNRINKYTIGAATQGLANYLKKTYPNDKIKVAVAHDSRNNSRLFAKITADVFSANGIHVYFFEELRPTPLLSFAVRELGCKSGVMLTASHNPKEYNGYKAYGPDGGQYVSPHDKEVMEEVKKITNIDQVKFDINETNVETVGADFDQLYLDKIASLSVSPEAIKRQKDLKIVYSPIHGTGITLVPKEIGRASCRERV